MLCGYLPASASQGTGLQVLAIMPGLTKTTALQHCRPEGRRKLGQSFQDDKRVSFEKNGWSSASWRDSGVVSVVLS